jgi:hypothetical protein
VRIYRWGTDAGYVPQRRAEYLPHFPPSNEIA